MTILQSEYLNVKNYCDDKSFKTVRFFIMFVISFVSFYQCTYSQEDTSKLRVIPLNNVVRYSTVSFKNNFPDAGEVFAFANGEETPIKKFAINETFEFEIGDIEKLNFYFNYLMYDGSLFPIKYELDVPENTEFKFNLIPKKGAINKKFLETTRKLKELYGQDLYEIVIDDDASPFRIAVEPLEDSKSFIDVIPTASKNTFVVKFKGKEVNSLLKGNLNTFKKGNTWQIPIGVKIFDPKILSHSEPRNLILKWTKK